MAVDLATVGVEFDTSGLKKGQTEMDKTARSGKNLADSLDKTSDSTKKADTGFSSFSNTLRGLAIGATVANIIKIADSVTLMDARLKLAVKGTEDFLEAQKQINRIATASNTSLQETSNLFTRLSAPVQRLGGGVRETAALVESFSLALKVSGASSQESASAIQQFGQALAGGALRGEEFNAVNEAAPRVMKALADGMGVPIEALRKMAEGGKLTADVVGNALVKSLEGLREEAAQIPQTVGAALQMLQNEATLLVGDFDKLSGGTGSLASLMSRTLGPALRGVFSIAVGVREVFITLGKAIGGVAAAIVEIVSGNGSITERVKRAGGILADAGTDISDGWQKSADSINKAWDESARTSSLAVEGLKNLTGAVGANTDATKKNAKATKEKRDEVVKITDAIREEERALFALMEGETKYQQLNDKRIETADQYLAQIEFETRLLTLNAQERAIATAERELERQGIVAGTEAYDAYIQRIREAVINREQVQASQNGIKEIAAEGKKFAEDLERGLTDSLFRAFESGKGFFKTLWDGIKNLFKTTVLKAIIQPVVGGLTGALGFAGAANAQTSGGGGLSGITNLLGGSASFTTDGIIRGLTSLSNAFPDLTSATSSLSRIVGANSQAINGLGNTLTGFAVGSGLNSAISGGFRVNSTTGTVQQIGIAVASYLGGPLGGAIAGAISGVFNRAFGRKLADTGVQGTFGNAGFEGESFQFLKGGLFRSDKTITGELDATIKKQLGDTFKAMQVQTALFAEALGVNASSVADFTASIKISTKGLTDEQIAEAFNAELQRISDQLVAATIDLTGFGKEGETLTQTLARLAGNLLGVNAAFDALGLALIKSSVAGADAAGKFIDLFGGIEQLNQVTSSYYQNFFTEAERTANTVQALTGEFSALGLEVPATREAFRELVEAQSQLGEASLPTVARLLQLSETFAAVVPPTEQLTEAASELATVVTDTVEAFQSAMVSLGPNPFTPTVDGFQSLLDGMNADIAAANAQIAGTVSNTYQDALDAIQARADELQAQLEPGFAANLQNQLDQATYGRSIAEGHLRYLQSVGDEVNAVFQQERITAFTAEILRLTEAMQTGPDVQAFIDSQIALLNFQNAQQATNLINGLNEAVADLGRTDAERRLAAIARQYNEYIAQLTDLNQLTPANIASLDAWRQAMIAAGNATVTVANDVNRDLERIQEERRRALEQAESNLRDAFDRERAELQKNIDVVEQFEDALKSAYDTQAQVFRGTVEQFRGFSKSLMEFRKSLDFGPQALLSPEAQYLANRARFEATSAAALSGDAEALANLQSVSEAYLESSQSYYASSEAYFADLEAVKNATEAAGLSAAATADVAQLQLDALTAQVSSLISIDTTAKTVEQAIADLNAAQTLASTSQAQIEALNARQLSMLGTINDTLLSLPQAIAEYEAAKDAANTATGGGGGPGATANKFVPLNVQLQDPEFRAETIRRGVELGYNNAKGSVIRQLISAGFSLEQIAADASAATGQNVTLADIQYLQGFAKGGYYPGGMALVGERGPELINFRNPGQVYTAGETQSIMGGGDEIRELRTTMVNMGRMMQAMQARLIELTEEANNQRAEQVTTVRNASQEAVS